MHTVNVFKFLPHSKHLHFVFCFFNFYKAFGLLKSKASRCFSSILRVRIKAEHTLKEDILFHCSHIKAPVEKVHIQLDPWITCIWTVQVNLYVDFPSNKYLYCFCSWKSVDAEGRLYALIDPILCRGLEVLEIKSEYLLTPNLAFL